MNNKTGMMKKLSAAVIATFMAASANASFLTIEAAGGFTEGTLGNGASATLSDAISPGIYSTVSWGLDAGNGLSSLVLEDFTVNVDDVNVNYNVSTLTHNNFAINGGSSLWLASAQIFGLMNLTSDFDDGNSGISTAFGSSAIALSFNTAVASIFSIDFTETYNQMGVIGNCTAIDNDGDDGTVGDHVNETACDDYFDYSIENLGGLPNTLPFAIPMHIDGNHYAMTVFATIDEAGTQLLPQDRFWTPEGQSSSIYTWVRLSRVPEPLTLGIMGLGLIGIGAARRKRKA